MTCAGYDYAASGDAVVFMSIYHLFSSHRRMFCFLLFFLYYRQPSNSCFASLVAKDVNSLAMGLMMWCFTYRCANKDKGRPIKWERTLAKWRKIRHAKDGFLEISNPLFVTRKISLVLRNHDNYSAPTLASIFTRTSKRAASRSKLAACRCPSWR